MANLATKTTSGVLSFEKYVTKNPNLASTWFRIEDNCQGDFYQPEDPSGLISTIPAGREFRIISDQIHTIYSKHCAKVNSNNVTGYVPINQIRKPTQRISTRYEDQVVTNLTGFGGALEICGQSYYIDGVSKVDSAMKAKFNLKRDPKADIVLTNKGYPAIFISHKMEGTSKSFQQYSGISSVNEFIYNHPETIDFVESLNTYYPDGMEGAAFRMIEDPLLKMAAVYGNDYGYAFGMNHVHLLAQGLPIIIRENGKNVLEFSSHMSKSGEELVGDYEPIFAASFRTGRVAENGSTRIKNARAGIYPCGFINGRKNLKVI